MGEFNSDDHYILYYGQESIRRNGVTIIVNKKVQNEILECSLKNYWMISACFQGKPLNITVIQVYASTSNAEEAEVEQFYEVPPTTGCCFCFGSVTSFFLELFLNWSPVAD